MSEPSCIEDTLSKIVIPRLQIVAGRVDTSESESHHIRPTYQHINIANMPNHRLTQRYWGTASNSDTRVATSDVEFNNAKLTILYRMLQV